MTNSNNYENLHFNRAVNTISAYPATFPLHWHKYVEVIVFPNNGSTKPCRIQIHQTTYELLPGDILFIWSGELHNILQNEGTALQGIQFSPSIFNDLPEFTPYLNMFRSHHHISHAALPALSENILFQVQHMLELEKSTAIFHGVEALICLLELFMEFGNHLKNNLGKDLASSASIGDKTMKKMTAACEYIANNCERELTLEIVADQAGFSACYFSRVFKQTTTYNFVEYLTLQRIKRAQMLLSDSNMSITEISYQSGFKSISTFNRVFKQSRGCSPSEYRKYYYV